MSLRDATGWTMRLGECPCGMVLETEGAAALHAPSTEVALRQAGWEWDALLACWTCAACVADPSRLLSDVVRAYRQGVRP